MKCGTCYCKVVLIKFEDSAVAELGGFVVGLLERIGGVS